DHELGFRGLLDRQVGRLFASENAADVYAGEAVRVRDAGPVAHQAAGSPSFAPRIDCGEGMGCRPLYEMITPTEEECIGTNHKPTCLQLDQGCKEHIDVAFRACMEDVDL